MGACYFSQIPIGAEEVGIGADDLEELSSDGEEYFRLGDADESFKDFSSLKLKPDHHNRCCSALVTLEALLSASKAFTSRRAPQLLLRVLDVQKHFRSRKRAIAQQEAGWALGAGPCGSVQMVASSLSPSRGSTSRPTTS